MTLGRDSQDGILVRSNIRCSPWHQLSQNWRFWPRHHTIGNRVSHLCCTYAVKSAAAVAALVASLFNVAPQTAPLWPKNVPIQSPVSPCRSIGLPSRKHFKTRDLEAGSITSNTEQQLENRCWLLPLTLIRRWGSPSWSTDLCVCGLVN